MRTDTANSTNTTNTMEATYTTEARVRKVVATVAVALVSALIFLPASYAQETGAGEEGAPPNPDTYESELRADALAEGPGFYDNLPPADGWREYASTGDLARYDALAAEVEEDEDRYAEIGARYDVLTQQIEDVGGVLNIEANPLTAERDQIVDEQIELRSDHISDYETMAEIELVASEEVYAAMDAAEEEEPVDPSGGSGDSSGDSSGNLSGDVQVTVPADSGGGGLNPLAFLVLLIAGAGAVGFAAKKYGFGAEYIAKAKSLLASHQPQAEGPAGEDTGKPSMEDWNGGKTKRAQGIMEKKGPQVSEPGRKMKRKEMAGGGGTGDRAAGGNASGGESPVERTPEEELEVLRRLPELLMERVIGQDHAAKALGEAVQVQRAGFGGDRPVSAMLCGTTGVGKTETARALADALFGGEGAMVRLDMSEYMDKLSASRITGAPPGYVGHEEAGQLTNPILENPRRVVLFDEIEKAHPDILNYLLQILDDGRLTDSHGVTVNFGEAVVLMTSNLASDDIRNYYERRGTDAPPPPERETKALLREDGMRPELVGRIEAVVTFRPLSPDDVSRIARLMVKKTSAQYKKQHKGTLTFSDEAIEYMARRGYVPEEGARPLRNTIRKCVEIPITKAFLSGALRHGTDSYVTVTEDGRFLDIRGGVSGPQPSLAGGTE